jgi:phosphatidylglycerol:prolipoprotein diacylglycerol transferase
MFPVLLKLNIFGFPLTIYTYGAMVSLGVLVSLTILVRMAEREKMNPDHIMDILIWVLLSGFAGARLVYIIVEWKTFLAAPVAVALSRSGFVFYGGLISGIIAAIWRIKKMKLNLWKTLDMFAIVVPLGHAFGRIGCFAFGCCYGRVAHSWLGVQFPKTCPAGASGIPVIPTQLIEASGLIILFMLLWLINRKKDFNGKVAAAYLVFYSIMRFIMEFFRGDDRGAIWFLSTSQIISIGFFIAGAILYYKLKAGKKI